MSSYGAYDDYDDEPRRYTRKSTRPRRGDDPEYVEETTYVEKGRGPPPASLVNRSRHRDYDDDDVEEVDRDFPPPRSQRPRGYRDYDDPPRRAASAVSRTKDRYEDEYRRDKDRFEDDVSRARDRYRDDVDDAEGAGAGAAGGYAVAKSRNRRRDRDDRDRGRDRDYYSEDDRSDRRKDDRRKSQLETTLDSLGLGGLGGIAGALAGGRSKSQGRGSQDRSMDGGGYSRSRGAGGDADKKSRQWGQAAQAALVAGAIEAFRSRGEPGPWTGEKGKRIATAAISAGGIDRIVDRDPNQKTKRHLVEAVLGGLAANRLANGPRDAERSGDRGRSRSRSTGGGGLMDRFRSLSRGRRGSASPDRDGRSRSQGGGGDVLKDVVAGAGLAGIGKVIYDKVRSRSQGRKDERERSASVGSEDSYVPSRNRRRGTGARDGGRDGGRDRSVGGNDSPRTRGGPDDGAVVGPVRSGRGAGAGAGAGAEGGVDGKKDDASDSISSTDMENQRKKMRGKEMLTAGLATVATIHAAHGVYQSMEASQKRHKLVQEGEMSRETARKKRSKAWLQDAAAIGIAALGIKGAYSEWKEMNEQRHSVKELEEKRRLRQKRHEQRLKDAQRNNGDGRYGGSGDQYMSGGNGGYGPYYNGGGDYGSVPPPPMGGGR